MTPKIFIHFLKTKNGLSQETADFLEKTIEKYATEACHLLDIVYVNISVYQNKNFTISETGEGGYAASYDWFHIYIDPTKSENKLKKIISNHIPSTVYHELNHVARWNSVGYGSTLLEAIISEGLASVFESEKWKKSKTPWAKYSQKEILSMLEIFKKRKKTDDANYNHQEWFYGNGKLPKWIGYKLGVYIICLIRKNNPEISWKKLMKMNAKKIFKLAKLEM